MGIRKEEDGTYTVFYSRRHPLTRKPHNMRRTKIPSFKKASSVHADLVLILNNKFEKSMKPFWPTFCEEFLVAYKNRGIKESTISNYRFCLRRYTYALWEERFIDTISTEDIRNLVKEGFEGKSESTKKNILKYIRAVFNYALEINQIQRDPTPKIEFKKQLKLKKVLTEGEIKHLLSKAKEYQNPWYPIWAMALYTGMRNGELIALRWDNVDLETRLITVKESWNKRDGTKETKSGDDRYVEIAPGLLPILHELKNRGDKFVLPRLEKWTKGDQARELRFFLTGIGLPQIRFHDLRASWATLMLSKGIEPIKVMSMGGWKDLKTMQIYIRKAGIDIRGITDGLELT